MDKGNVWFMKPTTSGAGGIQIGCPSTSWSLGLQYSIILNFVLPEKMDTGPSAWWPHQTSHPATPALNWRAQCWIDINLTHWNNVALTWH